MGYCVVFLVALHMLLLGMTKLRKGPVDDNTIFFPLHAAANAVVVCLAIEDFVFCVLNPTRVYEPGDTSLVSDSHSVSQLHCTPRPLSSAELS
jgi:hypothetical protein